MIRILYILHTLNLAGVERMVFDLIVRNRDILDAAVVSLDCRGPLAERLESIGVPVWCTHRRSGLDFSQVGKLSRIVQEFQPEIIHAHQYTPFFYSSLANRFIRRGRVIFTEHGRHFPDRISWKRRMVNRILIRKTARVTAVCDFTRQALIRNEAIPEAKIDIIYNGVDLQEFRPASAGNGKFVIVQVANFRSVKDHQTAIRAMKILSERSVDAELLLVGEGDERAKSEKLVAALHLTEQVKFLGRCDEVSDILCGADVIVNTSISEAHSLALLEGMAAGLAVVASNVGGNPEIVVDGETGMLFPAGDSEGLAESLIRLAEDANLRKRMGEAGLRRVQRLFSREEMHKKYIGMYKTLAEMTN